ncbi:hypothetical protein [Pontibacter kalidii]|uniref:hypothetical protein n=1 Tax=Pontibacter kalidii TaxID=2592049 RepID=UPI00225BB1AD|nr:hypothetical protein [Pontibacter kalidii]
MNYKKSRMEIVNSRDFVTAAVIAFLYVLLGTYELVGDVHISSFIRSIEIFNRIHLDMFTIFPAHVFGSFFWWTLGGGKSDAIAYAWLGQFLGLLFFFILFLLLVMLYKAIRKKLIQL